MIRNSSWIVRAGGNRYRHVNGYTAVKLINQCLKDYASPLSERQEHVLRESFGNSGLLGNLDMPFQVLRWEEEKPTGDSFLWRVTLPVLYIWVIFKFFIIESIHWTFTGKRSFGPRSMINVLTTRWGDKVLGR